jgi:ferredoxin
MKVAVDQERCQGHTLCAMKAPEVFQLDDIDGHSTPVSPDVPTGQEPNVISAVKSCPERAISVQET